MATDYWASSHHKKWVTDRLTLHTSRLEDLRYISVERLAFLNIFFANLITKIGKKLHFRQRVIATATVFFKRFFLKNNFCDTEPYIVLVACCYVAGKAEELPAHIKNVIQVANTIFGELGVWPGPLDNHRLAEMEFYLVDELECNLTVFHPYRSLLALCGKKSDVLSQSTSTSAPAQSKSASSTGSVLARGTTSLPTRGSATASSTDTVEAGELGAGIEGGEKYWGTNLGKLILDEKTLQLAWLIINDTYRTDVCLLYPPFLIAVAAIYLALVNHDSITQAYENEQGQTARTPYLGSSSVAPTPMSQSGPTPMATPTPGPSTAETPVATGTSSTPKPASGSLGPDPITFLANLNVSMAVVATIAQEMLSFYSLSARYSDDTTGAGSATVGNGALRKDDSKMTLPIDLSGNNIGLESMMMDIDGVQPISGSNRVFNPSSSGSEEKVRARDLIDLLKSVRWARDLEREREIEHAAQLAGIIGATSNTISQVTSPIAQLAGAAAGSIVGTVAGVSVGVGSAGKGSVASRSNQPVNKRLERAQAAG